MFCIFRLKQSAIYPTISLTTMPNSIFENEKQLAAAEAVKFLVDGQIVGLGSGSTATYAIKEIAELVKNGLKIKAIPTSTQTGELAQSLGILLIDINSIEQIDITIDGADEFTEDLTLVKGGGGALLREKVVASMSKKVIIIADSAKKVERLGKFKIPIEIIPFATRYVMKMLRLLDGAGEIRMKDNSPYLTDSGNHILDVDFGLIENPIVLAEKLDTITGIVEHGIFVNLAQKVIMGSNGEIIVFERQV